MNALTDTLTEMAEWDEIGLAAISERAAVATLEFRDLDPEEFEISVLGCNDARIQQLNANFREKDSATNVLSWPSSERSAQVAGTDPEPPEPGELGDIAIAYETCLREAAAEGIALDHHTTHLIVHAVLHLLGYDHEDDALSLIHI